MANRVKLVDYLDILYVQLRDSQIVRTDTYGDHRLVDMDAEGQVVGVEFIGLDGEIDLRGLPDEATLLSAVDGEVPSDLTILTNLVHT